jgi:hypothetical protein
MQTLYPVFNLVTVGDDSYELLTDCYVKDINLIIPKGAHTDFTSTPKGLRFLLPRDGITKFASVVHDFMSRSATNKYGKFLADCYFAYLLFLRLPMWKVLLIFMSLQLFKRKRRGLEAEKQ